jgi:hypothetical protein
MAYNIKLADRIREFLATRTSDIEVEEKDVSWTRIYGERENVCEYQ